MFYLNSVFFHHLSPISFNSDNLGMNVRKSSKIKIVTYLLMNEPSHKILSLKNELVLLSLCLVIFIMILSLIFVEKEQMGSCGCKKVKITFWKGVTEGKMKIANFGMAPKTCNPKCNWRGLKSFAGQYRPTLNPQVSDHLARS